MNGTNAPAKDVKPGDKIEHDLMPGFVMTVRQVQPCDPDGDEVGDLVDPHDEYLITDPEGNDDWLCAYDVHPVT